MKIKRVLHNREQEHRHNQYTQAETTCVFWKISYYIWADWRIKENDTPNMKKDITLNIVLT